MDRIEFQEFLNEYLTCTDKEKKPRLSLALCEFLQQDKNHEEARKYCQEALELAEAIYDNDQYCKALYLYSKSYLDEGEHALSKKYFERAYMIAEETNNNNHLANIYYYLAVLEQYNSNLQGAYYFAYESVKICEEYGYFDLLEDRYYHIGTIYADLQKYDLALYYFKQALKSSWQSEYVERQCMSIAELYYNIENYALALGYVKKALRVYVEKNDVSSISACELLIGRIYFKKGLYEHALKHLQKALNEATLFDSKSLCAKALLEIGVIYKTKKDYANAESYFNKLLEMEESVQDKKIILDFYERFIDFYKQTGNLEKEYRFYVKYVELQREVNDEEMMKNLNLHIANHEYEQKKKEVQIFKSKNTELAKSQKIIEEKNSDLLKLNEAKDILMNTISHDLKNYIGAAQLALETAILKDSSLAENKYMKMIGNSCLRALNLVRELLYSHKLEFDEKSVTLTLQDINQLLAGSEDAFLIRAKHKNIDMTFSYAEEPLLCMVDVETFHRIIENLCTNALKFTHSDGKIQIKTQKVNNIVQICIKDSGIGIEPDNIPKLFERFSGVGRKGTEGEESTGLGLYIVKKLIELHYGTIRVASTVGQGTAFLIELPGA